MRFIDKFPGTPRGHQEDVINQIDDSFNVKGKKFVICQAPTGSGKSHIGACLALSTDGCPKKLKHMDIGPRNASSIDNIDRYGCFVLTTSKQLQDQYSTIFTESSSLKGKANYACGINPIYNVSYAMCSYLPSKMDSCTVKGICEYVNKYSEAIKNKFSVLNYSMFLSLPDTLREKQILVCDEASELEDTLVSHYSVQIKYKTLDFIQVDYDVLKKDTAEAGFLWISALIANLKDAMPPMKELTGQYAKPISIDKANKIKELSEKLKLLHMFWNYCEFLVEPVKDGVSISPLKVDKLARLMFSTVDKVLLMSATIINHVKFAESLGIASDEYDFIDVDSDFDAKKSPIYLSPATFDMTYAKIDSSMKPMVNCIKELCEMHKDEKGVVHTCNFKINKAIQDALGKNNRFLFREGYSSNEQIIEQHFSTEQATVLVSPSLAFGTSLDDEFGRFQIVAKLPYLPMSDKRVKILAEKDFDWYQMKMWVKFIQMCGRCTRSSEDYSVTYILDKSIISAIKRYDSKLPKWFKNRLV